MAEKNRLAGRIRLGGGCAQGRTLHPGGSFYISRAVPRRYFVSAFRLLFCHVVQQKDFGPVQHLEEEEGRPVISFPYISPRGVGEPAWPATYRFYTRSTSVRVCLPGVRLRGDNCRFCLASSMI